MTRAWSAAIVVSFCLTTLLLPVESKVFTHCELAQELRRQQIPEPQIAIWVCIAHYESRLNTSAISTGGDHGIFQISQEYWCSPRGRGKACHLSCADLEDDDITDDVACVQTIFDEHQDLSGNGFNAWAVYPRCKKSNTANRFLKKCSSGSITDNTIDSEVDLRSSILSSIPSSYYTPSKSSVDSSSFYTPSKNTFQYFAPSRTSQDSSLYYTPSRSSVGPSSYYTPSTSSLDSSSYYTPIKSSPQYFSPSRSFQLSSKSNTYNPSKSYTYTRTPQNVKQDYARTPQNTKQDYTRNTFSIYNPFPKSSIFAPTPTAPPKPSYTPYIYSTSRPSSYSIGSIYFNPFESKSTASPLKIYSHTPKKIYTSSSSIENVNDYFSYKTTPAPVEYKSHTQSDTAAIKTSSPAYSAIKAPWADFPWWNGGK